jgi:hypothetical protein
LKSDKGLSAGKVIQGGGVLSLAQKIPKPSLRVRYIGRINDLNIWDKVLTSNEIEAMLKCGGSTAGNVKSWSDFRLKNGLKYTVFAKYFRKDAFICPANC